MDNSVEMVDNPLSISTLETKTKGMNTVLGIFAKEPVPGRVKTRLSPPFSPEEAARFYRSCLDETIAAMEGGGFDLVLFHDGETEYFRTAFPDTRLIPQGEGDLGKRMERALRTLLACGFETAALIGSDTPDLPPSLVREAFAALCEAEVVTAPSVDGGYVLVGERRHRPELFRAIPWSSDGVLAETRSRALEHRIAYREVSGWDDVDDLASLRRLIARSPSSPTAGLASGFLNQYGL